MAVYTKLNQKKIEEILSNYSLGKLDSFKGIEEGIENTNYFLSVNKKKLILTVYEKRVKSEDLPFFSNLLFDGVLRDGSPNERRERREFKSRVEAICMFFLLCEIHFVV